MIPTSFDYVRAESVKDALKLLAAKDGTKVIAGGHSLLPMMRFRLVQAPKLVDISGLADLKGVAENKKGVRIGALTTYSVMASDPLLKERCPVLAEVAGEIADLQVRNRGTVGGSLAHADPASDMPALMLAFDATFRLQSKAGGKRQVKAREFFQGPFTTAMTEDEILTEILVDGQGKRGGAYVSFSQAASGYALAACCALVKRSRLSIGALDVAFTGLGEVAFLAPAFGQLVGTKGDAAAIDKASGEALADVIIAGDLHADATYRRHLGTVVARRAIQLAYQRAG